MSSKNFEATVKGATKIKLAAPKAKYIESILAATHGGEAGVAEIFRTLQNRLRDSTWTIVFKSLIVVHLMIREGDSEVTLRYLAESPRRLAISNFSDIQVQGTNIRRYSDYLVERAIGYASTKTDYVRYGVGRLKRLTVEKGLLRETESVQKQIKALLRCDLLSNDPDNEITLTAFRLLTMDLLVLFSVMNEGTINVLERYFEMSKPDAERALNIYKSFSRQTDQVVQFLSVARQYQFATRLEIPKLKHAPTSLTGSLEEYLNDPDFEINRRQYLVQQEAKKSGKVSKPATSAFDKEINVKTTSFPAPKQTATAPVSQPKGPAPDLIDFFGSIEQNQQPMAQQAQSSNTFQQPQAQQFQQTGFAPQQPGFPQQAQAQQYSVNPFGQPNGVPYGQPQPQQPTQQQAQPLQPNFTGAGFGGYTPQPQPLQPYNFEPSLSSIPQNGTPSFSQPQHQQASQPQQSSNPFRQSALPNQGTNSPVNTTFSPSPLTRQSTNPFKKVGPQDTGLTSPQTSFSNSPFISPPPLPQAAPQQQMSTIQPQRTGTNPFARSATLPLDSSQPAAAPLRPNITGSTNPFRQSAFVNQQTGQGWQSGQGAIGSGLENLETVPVFPRPGQMT